MANWNFYMRVTIGVIASDSASAPGEAIIVGVNKSGK